MFRECFVTITIHLKTPAVVRKSGTVADKATRASIEGLFSEINALARQDQSCMRLMNVPGTGPVIVSADRHGSVERCVAETLRFEASVHQSCLHLSAYL